jgi:hypothetical protein
MQNLFDLQENKISTSLTGYSMVIMGETGDGKTFSLDKILRSLSDGKKKPLFIMLEDRYQHIPNIMALRVHNIPELLTYVAQLKSPKAKELYSCIVFDTADKLDTMIEKYVAQSKEVEITGELNFGAGNKYIKSRLFFIDELRNDGWTVHFVTQCWKNTNIITQKTSYDHKLNKETWAKISHDAYLIGYLGKDPSNPKERMLTFEKTSELVNLKDSIGLPKTIKASEFRTVLEKSILNIEGAVFTKEETINTKAEEVDFEAVKTRGMELGQLLASKGYLEDAMNVLKVNLGYKDDKNTQPKMFDDLLPAQAELAQVVVLELEKLITKYGLKG